MIDFTRATHESEHEIGTIFMGPACDEWRYVRIAFAQYEESEACAYQWIPWNGVAKKMAAVGIFTPYRFEYGGV